MPDDLGVESSSKDYSCPSNQIKQITKPSEVYTCASILTNSTDFRISACQASDSCNSGYILIERTDQGYCEKAKAIAISNNPTFTEQFHTLDGPDSFYVNFTGAEKYSIYQWSYEDGCKYKFPYQFSNAGTVFLNILHVYKDYDGVNEVFQDWPPYLDSTLVSRHQMEICPGCPTLTSNGSVRENIPETQECDREGSTHGSWLPASANIAQNLSTSGYLWEPSDCSYPDKFRGVDSSGCLENPRSILFFGDSQIRVMYDNLWRRLDGSTARIVKMEKFLDMRKEIGNVVLWHHKDVFLEDIVSRDDAYLMKYDTIVFNFAQWPASGLVFGGHWTTDRFLNVLDNATDFLVGVQSRRPKDKPLRLVWQGIHAFSMKNIYSKKRGDWRTINRLKNWNRLAENMARSKGIRTMNSFEITYSMLDVSPDNAHYFGTDVEEAVVDEVLHKLDLCRPI
ncbi:hypothetical protein K493DRAFT_298360 [Basidiobolus meristosporus CBS 931.73]|uniref:Uncharacterized protein n=1 Tax=Basidiobolus meristosporus CBS 931.73 TaxID=1314790 RepID=A0A1Y1YUE7_9FUNG|nr:hypothetical protein K493DRAFT_298360 [Basidiobolus meristosporus CBS 931.73]|eukprot:ORY01464.1 hypothetical protein K493DRAFT_298360 [Basidiobolus meristosporus CBS 931.73]